MPLLTLTYLIGVKCYIRHAVTLETERGVPLFVL